MRTLLLLFALASIAVAGEAAGRPAVLALETTRALAGHEGRVRTLAFDPSGARLASGGPDRTLRIWSLETQAQVASVILPRGG